MHFITRAAIALLSGVGSGTLGFWIAWQLVWAVAGEHPGIGYDAWLVAGIFVPGMVVPFAVFWRISRKPGNAAA